MYHAYSYGPMYNPYVCTIYRTAAAPQRVFLVASSATSDRQFRHSNRPIRCFTATQSIHTTAVTNTLPRGCCIYQTKSIYQREPKNKIRLRPLLLIPRAKCKVAVKRSLGRAFVRMSACRFALGTCGTSIIPSSVKFLRKWCLTSMCLLLLELSGLLQAQSLLRCPQGR